MKIAILGAGGFIGSRAVEYLTLTGKAEVRGVVRRYSSLARLSRFAVDWRKADASNEGELVEAFRGCDVVLHSVIGDYGMLSRCALASYRAAERAGVRRIVLISTAAVYGGSPGEGIDESTEPSTRGLGDYGRAKLRCETAFRRLARRGGVSLVVLRPGIVVGPRSTWISDAAGDLKVGSIPLVGGGPGVCNSIYVDNLIDAVLLAAQTGSAAGGVYLVGDDDCVTWAEYYRRLAGLLGFPHDSIEPVAAAAKRPPGLRSRLESLRQVPAVRALELLTPSFLKNPMRRSLGMTREAALSWTPPGTVERGPLIRELIDLHVCPWRLSSRNARRDLGYIPGVSVDEGLRRSVEWLRYAGLAPRPPGPA